MIRTRLLHCLMASQRLAIPQGVMAPMSIVWEKVGDGFYATVREPAGEMLYRLTVENDGSRWIWTVWRPSQYAGTVRRGHAATLHGAMWDAEQASAPAGVARL